MSLFTKMIQEGWWDRDSRKESDIDVSRLTDSNIDDLLKYRQTLVVYDNRAWHVGISENVPIDDLKGTDFEIVELT